MLRFSLFAVAAVLAFSALQTTVHAQGMSYSVGRYAAPHNPELNNYLSARYDYLLQTNRRFRNYRMWKECHTINWVALHNHCISTFDEYEPWRGL